MSNFAQLVSQVTALTTAGDLTMYPEAGKSPPPPAPESLHPRTWLFECHSKWQSWPRMAWVILWPPRVDVSLLQAFSANFTVSKPDPTKAAARMKCHLPKFGVEALAGSKATASATTTRDLRT